MSANSVARLCRLLRPQHYTYLALHVVLLLVGTYLTQLKGPVWVGCGSSLIAAAITGWVVFIYIFLSQRRSELLDLIAVFGLKGAFDGRSVSIREEYDSRLKRATKAIDVLGFGQRSLREDHSAEFASWSQRAVVRILLIDPEFPAKRSLYADQRDTEEGDPPKRISRDVRAFIDASRAVIAEGGTRFQVRLYTCLPSINVFRIDDELFWGPYLIGQPSRNSPTFLVGDDGILFRKITEHFDKIWDDPHLSRAVPEDWLNPNGGDHPGASPPTHDTD
jgi:hypothetical protein